MTQPPYPGPQPPLPYPGPEPPQPSGPGRRMKATALVRQPLEYTPSSTTTLNHDRLNEADQNYGKLKLEFFDSTFAREHTTGLTFGFVACVVAVGLLLFFAPLFALSLGPVWYLALFLGLPLALGFLVALLDRVAAQNAFLALGSIAALAMYPPVLLLIDQDPVFRAFGSSIVVYFGIFGLFWVTWFAIIAAVNYLHATPLVVIAQAAVLAHPWKALENWIDRHRALAWNAIAVVAFFASFFYSLGILFTLVHAIESWRARELLIVMFWIVPTSLLTLRWFGRATWTYLLYNASESGAPGIWTPMRGTAGQRRMLALAALLAMHTAFGVWSGWGLGRQGGSRLYDGGRMHQGFQGSFLRATVDQFTSVMGRVTIGALASSLAVVASIAPVVALYELYRRRAANLAQTTQSLGLTMPYIYAHRLQHSSVALEGADEETVFEFDHIYLGYEPFQRFPILLHRPLLHEHCYIVGDSGSGKTSLGLIPLITNFIGFEDGNAENPAIVILDLKGDMALFESTRIACEEENKAFRFFTPERQRRSFFFNPLTDIDADGRRTAIQVAELLLDALALNHGEGYGRSYYSRRNRDILLDTLTQDPRPTTFEELHATLERLVQADAGRYRDSFELLATIRALTFYPQLNTKPKPEDLPRTIHMPTVIEEAQVAYFWLPSATESVSVRELGKLAVYSLLNAAIARRTDENPRRVYLVIDEFQRLAGENFKVVLEQARSFGIGVILANQSVSELKTPAADLRSVVRSNTRVKMHFSVQDPDDLRDIADASGVDLVTNQSVSITEPAVEGVSTRTQTTSYSVKPRLTATDILAISDHPRRLVLHVTRGSGLTQFGGRAIPVQADYITSKEEYNASLRAPWPEDEGLAISSVDPRVLDAQARQEILAKQRDIVKSTFDEAGDD